MMENLENLLNISPEEPSPKEIVMVPDKNDETVLVPQTESPDDFDALCAYQKTILEKTQTVLDSALEIAVLTQDPRAV
ncbi:MAG: hypothetical protein N3A54_01185, partial [Patescibacteria group bacterium]|nr:hypothetical protein [Patescibacteria group bacterium]